MEINFNKPQRQSSIGILVLFLDTLQMYGRAFLPIIIIWFFNSKNNIYSYVFLIIIVAIVLLIIFAYLQYVNFTFYIDDQNDAFIVNDGIVNKTKTTIQLNKIQQVTIHQNLIQRIINVYSLSVDTAGTDTKEGKIKAISHAMALALKYKLLENETLNNEENLEELILDKTEKLEHQLPPFLKIKLLSLIKIGFTSNYLKSIVLLLTFFFTIFENLRQIGKEDIINQVKIEKTFSNYPLFYSILFFLVALFMIIFIINIVRTVLKYFNYTITKQKGSLLLSFGLINTDSTILKPEKVQIVKISRNYFQKKLNILEIKIKQATSDNEKSKKSQIEIPGCNSKEKDEILQLIFGMIPEKGLKIIPNFRKLVFSIFLTIILPLSIFFIVGNYIKPEVLNFLNIAIVYCVFVLLILFFAFRNYKLFISQNHIIKQSGAWDIDNEIIEIKKIQAIATSQLFWHKNLNIGSITLSTAAGTITFQLGNYNLLKQYMNLWLYEIESSNSNWM